MTEYEASHVVRQSDPTETFRQLPYKIHALSTDECEVICYNVVDRTVLSDEQYADLKSNGHFLPGDLLRLYNDGIWSVPVSVEKVFFPNNDEGEICKSVDNNNDGCGEKPFETNNELISLLLSDESACPDEKENGGGDCLVINDILFPSNQLLLSSSDNTTLTSYRNDLTLVVYRDDLSWEFVHAHVRKYTDVVLEQYCTSEFESMLTACSMSEHMMVNSAGRFGYFQLRQIKMIESVRNDFICKYALNQCRSIYQLIAAVENTGTNIITVQHKGAVSLNSNYCSGSTSIIVVCSSCNIWYPVRYSTFWKNKLASLIVKN